MKNTITIGANTNNPITINRMGYGTMRLPGDFVWGEPKNKGEALEILRTASSKGINFLDTADFTVMTSQTTSSQKRFIHTTMHY